MPVESSAVGGAGTAVPLGALVARRYWRGSAAGAGLGDQAELVRPGNGLGAVGCAEFAEEVADVLLDGVKGDHELLGDARVRSARGQQDQDFPLAGGQLLDQPRHRRGAVSSGASRSI